jgi:hypothetical protein
MLAYLTPVPSLMAFTTPLQSDVMITCDIERPRARDKASRHGKTSNVAGSETPEHLNAEDPKYVPESSLQTALYDH